MDLYFGKYEKTNIVDRTLCEVYSKNPKMSRLDLIDLCWMLKEMKVDYIEVDFEMLKKIDKIPSGLEFVLRIDSDESLQVLLESSIEVGIIVEDIEDKSLFFNEMVMNNKKAILEYRCDNINDLDDLEGLFMKDKDILNGSIVRITGLSKFISTGWCNDLNTICMKFNTGIAICAENNYFNGTATTLEAMMNNFVFVTTSFLGFGINCKYSPLEQVLNAASVIIGLDEKPDLKALAAFKKRFQKNTGIVVNDILSIYEARKVAGL